MSPRTGARLHRGRAGRSLNEWDNTRGQGSLDEWDCTQEQELEPIDWCATAPGPESQSLDEQLVGAAPGPTTQQCCHDRKIPGLVRDCTGIGASRWTNDWWVPHPDRQHNSVATAKRSHDWCTTAPRSENQSLDKRLMGAAPGPTTRQCCHGRMIP